MASKHNIYLATCRRSPDCLLVICNNPPQFTAAAYYANGITNANSPTELATVTDPASPWEGTPRTGRFRTTTFTSSIDAGAKALAKGEIAGQATLGTEEFICFKDGQSKFTQGSIVDDRTIGVPLQARSMKAVRVPALVKWRGPGGCLQQQKILALRGR
ncbi:hypothetical protein N0V90_007472 [Kalmusia sp. IMI 367209]|nr:hypothetical protein N0V90_007472 [Kalmusia sp. IMI 367209]